MINVSIVLYNNDETEINHLIKKIIPIKIINKIFVIDNSEAETNILFHDKVKYIFNNENLGYGKAHNIALKESIKKNIFAHLILNPDVEITEEAIKKLYNFLKENEKCGIVVPKVYYKNGNVQYLSKLLPEPSDLIIRRFLKNFNFAKNKNYRYELQFTGYNKPMEIGVASGSCMLIRVEALKKSGLFDERFFMYLEDYDLSRRIGLNYKVIFYPEAEIIHRYEMHSYKKLKMLIIHVISAIKYFNKWGWYFDKYRKNKNRELLRKLEWKDE